MILVGAFYAIVWLPEKIFVLLVGLDVNLNARLNVLYAATFFGFLYICANLTINATGHCVNVVSCMYMYVSGGCSIMTFARITSTAWPQFLYTVYLRQPFHLRHKV